MTSQLLSDFTSGRRGARPVPKREFILDMCADRSVLDVGCVQHSWKMAIRNPRWMHGALREVAASCVGVDYLADDVEQLRSRGYDIVYGNVLEDRPPGSFDRVVLGDILEHVEDPATLLAYTADALTPDGIAIITTPNPFYLGQFLTIGARGAPTVNPEHVAFYDPITFASLIERSPLELVEMRWLTPSFPALWDAKSRIVRKIVSPAMHRAGSLVRSRRPYLNSDFAGIVRLRRDAGPSSIAERGAKVAEFHGVA